MKKLLKEYDVGTLDSRQARRPPNHPLGRTGLEWGTDMRWSPGPSGPPKASPWRVRRDPGEAPPWPTVVMRKRQSTVPKFSDIIEKMSKSTVL